MTGVRREGIEDGALTAGRPRSVIPSRRRRILVRAANKTNAIKYQSAGRLPIDNQPKIFRAYPQGFAQLLSEKGA